MEGRMTVCNMSIEMGARGGMIAPDQTTFDYIKGREFAPKGTEFEKKLNIGNTPNRRRAKLTRIYFDAEDMRHDYLRDQSGMGIKISDVILRK